MECLVEYGYAGTTTLRVAEKSGLTRGAQVHHFGSKNELVVAAVRYVATRVAGAAIQEMRRMPAGADIFGHALDIMWHLHRGPIFIAMSELWVAARTDENLAKHLTQLEPVVAEALLASGFALPNDIPLDELRALMFTAMDTIRGLLMLGFASHSDKYVEAQWRRAREHLMLLADSVRTKQSNG